MNGHHGGGGSGGQAIGRSWEGREKRITCCNVFQTIYISYTSVSDDMVTREPGTHTQRQPADFEELQDLYLTPVSATSDLVGLQEILGLKPPIPVKPLLFVRLVFHWWVRSTPNQR